MIGTLKLSARNLMRYHRRTLLTVGLITIGVVGMLLFVSAAGSFRNVMIGQITDSMLGHLQVHRRGGASRLSPSATFSAQGCDGPARCRGGSGCPAAGSA
jgi:ABC-type lipoprotein release transport system permease subunit